MRRINNCKTCDSDNLTILVKDVNSFGFKFDIVECADCGCRFRNIELDKKETEEIYSEKYFLQEQKDYFFNAIQLRKEIFSNRLKLVNHFCKDKGRLLDLGSALGTFLEVAKNDGWEETGLEISSFAAKYAKQRGLNNIISHFDGISQLSQTFDVVTLWDAIDHAERPLNLLGDLHKVVKKGGYIFVGTTVIDSTIYILSEALYKLTFGLVKGPLLKGYPVHHSNHYSQKSLSNDIEKAGFKVVKVVREAFNKEMFSGGKLGKVMFGLVEKLSKHAHKEMVCIIIAQAD